jgi:hypothetical protein
MYKLLYRVHSELVPLAADDEVVAINTQELGCIDRGRRSIEDLGEGVATLPLEPAQAPLPIKCLFMDLLSQIRSPSLQHTQQTPAHQQWFQCC